MSSSRRPNEQGNVKIVGLNADTYGRVQVNQESPT